MITDLMNVIGYTVGMIALGFTMGYSLGYIARKIDKKIIASVWKLGDYFYNQNV